MKIFYVAMEYDYGFPERGKSFEEYAFYDSFIRMGHEVVRFDFKMLEQKYGRIKMNMMLEESVFDEKPDLVFTVLFQEEIEKEVIGRITKNSKAITLNWFCDDHWRFDIYSKYWAPFFSWITTTDAISHHKYKILGYKNAILTQWGVNQHVFRHLLSQLIEHEVTFVGQPYGQRKIILQKLKADGINVINWGFNSENGRIDQESLVRVFNQSKINLNFSSAYREKWKFWIKRRDQIKARNFEIPACAGFQLASYVDGIQNYFEIDKEIVCYRSYDELVDKISYYLQHEKERTNIAEAGYKRTMQDHTYEKRFNEIFRIIFGG